MIHDVITTADHFRILLNSFFSVSEIIKLNNSDGERDIEYAHSVVVYKRISNSVGRNNNFLAKARKLSILPTSVYIFYARQHYVRILYSFSLYT